MFAPAAIVTLNDAAEAEARAGVAKVARDLARPGMRTDGAVSLGRAADVIVDECASFRPDLIIVGSRGRGGIAASVLGSVSAEVVDRAACPVLIARRTTAAAIVLAEDGSDFAAAGARAITALAPLRTADVRVVSVVDVPFPVVFADPTVTTTAVEAYRAYEDAMPQLREIHARYAQGRAQALVAEGIRATAERREGDAAGEIIAAAREANADLIVIGSRGQTGLRRLMLGSVARSVIFHAPCSVLVAHERAAGNTAVSRPEAAPAHV